jgi:RimJ/RimL family protein N-acetyltransferase
VTVTIRPQTDADIEDVFRLESDELGSDMIAFLPRAPGDRTAFEQAWVRYTTTDGIIYRIVEVDGAFAGYVLSFLAEDERQVGYWIDRQFWGRGVASAALGLLLAELPGRPLFGRVAGDNSASRRVLEKAGFVLVDTVRELAPRRGHEIDELVLRLDLAAAES